MYPVLTTFSAATGKTGRDISTCLQCTETIAYSVRLDYAGTSD